MSTIYLLVSWGKESEVYNNIQLQVLHLSTSHTGGAGIAAQRLHKSLLQIGVRSGFLTLENRDFFPGPNDLVVSRNVAARLTSKFTSFINTRLYKSTYFSLFSYSNLNARKLKKFGVDQKTVLHLHNWFNLLNYRSLSNLLGLGFRVVITLHDERFYTGGCHYSLQCSNFTDTCSHCPLIPKSSFQFQIKKNHRNLKRLVDKYNQQLTFIAPSQWIMDQAKMSSILRTAHVIQQPNVHEDFESEFNNLYRESLAKPANHFNIGVASLDSTSPLKGADLIPAILSKLKLRQTTFNLVELVRFPKTQDGYMQFWRNIDCLLVLSRADNSPNVIHEARIARVPVITTNVGGIPELIDRSRDFLFNFDENLIDNVSRAIIEVAERDSDSPEKNRTRMLQSAIKEPLRGLLEVYSFNS